MTWPGWDRSYDAWLTPAELRARAQDEPEKGAAVDVEWNGRQYPGKVVKTELGLLLVHYDGYSAADDEWVPLKRVTVRGQ